MLKKAKMEIARHDHGSSFASDIQCEAATLPYIGESTVQACCGSLEHFQGRG